MVKQNILVTDKQSPDYDLSFEELVYRGYDTDSDANKQDSFSVRGCPTIISGAIDSILFDTEIPKLKYISDVTRYATIMGASKIQHSPKLERIILRKRQIAKEVTNIYSMFLANTNTSIQYISPVDKEMKSKIETLYWVKAFSQSTCKYLGMTMSQLGVYMLIEGLCTARIGNLFYKDGLEKEKNMFWEHVDQIELYLKRKK